MKKNFEHDENLDLYMALAAIRFKWKCCKFGKFGHKASDCKSQGEFNSGLYGSSGNSNLHSSPSKSTKLF